MPLEEPLSYNCVNSKLHVVCFCKPRKNSKMAQQCKVSPDQIQQSEIIAFLHTAEHEDTCM